MILPVDVFENQNYLLHDNRDELDLLLNVQMVVYDYHKNHEIFHWNYWKTRHIVEEINQWDKYFDDVEEILDGPDETEFVGEWMGRISPEWNLSLQRTERKVIFYLMIDRLKNDENF